MRVLLHTLLGAGLLLSGQMTLAADDTIVEMQTNTGTITIKLDYTHAPISSANFIKYVHDGFYQNTIMHRIIAGFVVQGGGVDKATLQFKKPTYPTITLESNNGLKNIKGSVAMARTGEPNSASSQFFINLVDNAFLDYTSSNPGYAVFGQVIKGMDIVTAMGNALNWSTVVANTSLALSDQYEPFSIDAVYSSPQQDSKLAKTRITITPNGKGRVSSSPTGIACSSQCQLSQTPGSPLTLTAKPISGYAFIGWRGDCRGYNASITLDTKKGNHNCSAVFDKTVTTAQ